ncbi:MAG: PilZ domain-containing protein [Candidatus Omnitrophota bacterium]
MNTTNQTESNDELIAERRKFVRLNVNVDINYTVVSSSGGSQKGRSRNIGAGGICLLINTEVHAGDLVKLDISLPDDPPTISANGRIAWVKPFTVASEKNKRYDAGIEFTDISDDDRKKINKYVFSLKLG